MRRVAKVLTLLGAVASQPAIAQGTGTAASATGSPAPAASSTAPSSAQQGSEKAPDATVPPATTGTQPVQPALPLDTRLDAPPPDPGADPFAPLPADQIQNNSLVPQPALPAAQPGFGSNAVQTLLLPLGATQALLGLKFDAGFSAEYQSNMFDIGEGFVRPGQKLGDWRYTPSIGVDAGHDFGRQQVFVRAALSYNFYRTNEQYNRQQILVNGGVDAQIGASCTLGAQGSYSNGQSNFNNLPTAFVNVVASTSWGVSGKCGQQYGLSPFFNVNGYYQRNSDPNQSNSGNQLRYAALDQNAMTYSGGVSYNSPALGTLTISLSYTDTEYPFRPSGNLNGDPAENTSLNLGFSYSRQVGTRLLATAGLSYITSDSNVIGVSNFGGLGYNLSVSYQVSPTITLNIYGNRSVNNQNSTYSNSTLVTSIGGDVSYQIGQNLRLQLSGSIIGNVYRGFFQTVGNPLVRQNEQISFVDLGLSYTILRNLSFNASLNWTKRNADPDAYDYTSKGGSVGLQFNF